MASFADASFDAIITDPPYAEIDRDYGRLSESEWHGLMRDVIGQVRRLLKPTGSAVFVLQANSERVGRVRPWLFEFMAWTSREWNLVQDVWWWNISTPPTGSCQRKNGLMRPSVKACVWLGAAKCYRNQDAVLWTPSESMARLKYANRARRVSPSGMSVRAGKIVETVAERGGVTPYNLLPISNGNSVTSGGAKGHGAATPEALCDWWVRYITRPGDLILDPFFGSGTVGAAALKAGRSVVGIEQHAPYVELSRQTLITAEAPDAG
ncbi:site-specific DNA-methyltransferase [Myxococcus sp. K38C18041901]|uniref:DNA-methyltransferase n=1 Tax=Myxococcus guangdongensis TaxID=2906760 RepID=UPI0020A72DB9|nr:site-specific DNA-methyltransferase [Myxococcus guangdongensis]MCP3060959.1 site-specific DNA-methyltransferase [Myxococcus guangdongensis]